MSALTYYLLSKPKNCVDASFCKFCIGLALFMFVWLPPNLVGAAETPTPAAPQAKQAKTNSSPKPVLKPAQTNDLKPPAKTKSAETIKAIKAEVAKNAQTAGATNTAGDAANNAQTNELHPEGAQGEGDATAQNTLPESKSKSAAYLKTFDISGKRDPFTEIGSAESTTASQDTTWWQEAAEDAEKQDDTPQGYRFDGTKKPTHTSYARLPLIKVTGIMQVSGRRAVSAIIQNKGVVVLYESDVVIIDAKGKANLTNTLTIKKIHLNGMTVVLDDGTEIEGNFY